MKLIPKLNGKRGKLVVGLLVVPAIGVLSLGIRMLVSDLSAADQRFVYYTVSRTEIPIVVTERGNLESQQKTQIRCQVESRADRGGDSGTRIISIVPNGSAAKKDDLLVELDSAPIREKLDTQTITHDQAVAAQIQAQAKHENQIEQNKTLEAEADLKVELAKLELEMYQDKENGTYHLEVEAINREIEDANNQILAAEEDLALKKNDMRGIESLFKLGYAGKSEWDRSRLSYLQAESAYGARLNSLKTKLATLGKKEHYEYKMQIMQLEGNLATAHRSLKQVGVDSKSLMAQAKAALDAANKSLAKEKERLEKLEEQLANCKILAPHDGMVVYHREWRREAIAEGVTVYQRQIILSLPDLSTMEVKTYVHESVMDQVHVGQRATVQVDAFPDRTYEGVVHSIGVVPAERGWTGGDVKTYETVVRIEKTVERLKPGMTAVVEIDIDCIKDVFAVPVQAVVQVERDTWCYVANGGDVEQRMIKLGRTNDKFIHVRQGLSEGDRVVLNPMLILDQQKKTEEGGPESEEAAPADKGAESVASKGQNQKESIAKR